MKARWVAVCALALLVVVPPAGAQMDAGDGPTFSGPLRRAVKECAREEERNDNGRVIAEIKSCLRFYFFDAAEEDSAARDYGAIWLQTNVDSRFGWCVTSVMSDIVVPRGTTVHERRPKTVRRNRRWAHTTKLVVDANGHAIGETGLIKKRFTLFPRLMRGYGYYFGGRFRTAWYGSEARKLALASGIEISWAADRVGNFRLRSKLEYNVKKKGTC